MRKISVINYKGGTGKTSLTVNLGHGLALQGYKVLIVDTDPQGSVAHHLGITPELTLYDLLMDSLAPADCVVTARPNLDLICANERLFAAEIQLSKLKKKEKFLSEKLKDLANYDFILLDCAPSFSILNLNVLLYCEEVFIPVSMEYLSLLGVKQLLKTINIIIKIFQHHVRISKVIPTFYDKRYNKSQDILTSLNRAFPGKVTTPIRTSTAISEAVSFGQTIFECSPKSNGINDYYNLIQEVLSL